ncbi:hypothetical protein SY2F82_60550 [Streptomyces sp. Y2F8-2]|nr:hypothetical protein SY2F82_60550 [Streptomyces sp. Y2F8-2]
MAGTSPKLFEQGVPPPPTRAALRHDCPQWRLGGCNGTPLPYYLIFVPVERRFWQASSTRFDIDVSASLPQVRGS